MELTPQQQEDARDALNDVKRVIVHLEDGEADLEEVARVLVDNKQYIDPILQLVLVRRGAGSQGREGQGNPAKVG